jgi:outer membrane lipoprotein SlyB
VSLTAVGLAVFILGFLIFTSQGVRLRIFVGALCGAAIGGILTTIALALFGGLARVPSAIFGAFT